MHVKVLRSDVTAVLSLALWLHDKVDRIIIGLLDFAAIHSVNGSAPRSRLVLPEDEGTVHWPLQGALNGGGARQVRMRYLVGYDHAPDMGHSLPASAHPQLYLGYDRCQTYCRRKHRGTLRMLRTQGWVVVVGGSSSGPPSIHLCGTPLTMGHLSALRTFCGAGAVRSSMACLVGIDSKSMRASGTAPDTRICKHVSSFTDVYGCASTRYLRDKWFASTPFLRVSRLLVRRRVLMRLGLLVLSLLALTCPQVRLGPRRLSITLLVT
jgi:hypothetical protein